jgi:citronellol/citronellal dehydrogenase
MANLSGKVAIVTGASRGIGRSVALGLARAGCHIVVAAKSTESTTALPGSIYSVADEIRSAGVQALPARVDVRDSDQIDTLVAQTIEHFGRVDILINNAGALWWQALVDTPPKRFDLVMGVNVRAAFCASRAVLPHMMRQGAGHIVNFSPPIDYQALPGRIAYCVSKFGMTLLTLGLAEEVRPHNIAVNSLWPATIIESQASINWKLGDPARWRKPEIITDCVLRIVDKPAAELTGQALIDEDFLRAQGVTDFSQYACVPGTQPPRMSWARVAGAALKP